MKPKVSVIIPTYNMGDTLEKAIRSVFNQTLRDIELIVVDDGSGDDTHEVIIRFLEEHNREDISVRYIYQKNEGKPSAINTGLDLAKGKYVALLDADDTLPIESLRKRYDFLVNNALLEGVYGDTAYFRNGDLDNVRRPNTQTQEDLARDFIVGLTTPFHPMSIMLLTNKAKEIRFSERYRRAEDIDFAYRCLQELKFEYVDDVVYNYSVDTHCRWKRVKYRLNGLSSRLRILKEHCNTPADFAYNAFKRVLIEGGKLVYEMCTTKKNGIKL